MRLLGGMTCGVYTPGIKVATYTPSTSFRVQKKRGLGGISLGNET